MRQPQRSSVKISHAPDESAVYGVFGAAAIPGFAGDICKARKKNVRGASFEAPGEWATMGAKRNETNAGILLRPVWKFGVFRKLSVLEVRLPPGLCARCARLADGRQGRRGMARRGRE